MAETADQWVAWTRVIYNANIKGKARCGGWRRWAGHAKAKVLLDRLHVYCARHAYPDPKEDVDETKPVDIITGCVLRFGDRPGDTTSIQPGEFPQPPEQWWLWGAED